MFTAFALFVIILLLMAFTLAYSGRALNIEATANFNICFMIFIAVTHLSGYFCISAYMARSI